MSGSEPVIAAVAAGFGRDLEQTFARVAVLLDAARRRRAGLVVLPECALGGYLREPDDEGHGLDLPPALAPDGPEIARLARLAGDVVVCAGYTEAGETGLHSSAVCVSGDGVLGHQRKVHLPPAERFAYTPGGGFAAFDTPAGRIGMLICYDKLFPEAARAPVAASVTPSGSTTLAPPRKRRRPQRPAMFDDAHTTWFSTARAASVRSKWRVWRSSRTRRAGLRRSTGQAARQHTTSAPSSASARAASAKSLS